MRIQKVISIIMCAAVINASKASAESIPGLFNTGVNNNGERLPYGSLEEHYTLSGMATTAYVFTEGGPIPYPGYWVSPSADAMWIGPNGGDFDGPVGEYIYTLTFDLAGMDSTKDVISGQWTSDNESTIFFNGVPTEFTAGVWAFLSTYDFTISDGFLPGVNTLEFHVTNQGAPTGLLVQNLHGESVPEPATIALLGLGALTLLKRRVA